MSRLSAWPAATELETARLRLEPLRLDHAPEAFPVLDDKRLHTWTGGRPHTLPELEERYRVQAAGHSPDGRQGWLNWIVRQRASGQVIGTVQATVSRRNSGRMCAELAWVIGVPHQGQGYGREASLAMATWLRRHGMSELSAHIHPSHQASQGVARTLGLTATHTMSGDEVRWSDADRRAGGTAD